MDWDIVIAGGGAAGLTAAVALGQFGLRILCLDPTSPASDGNLDLRTTAILKPGRRLLEAAGLWDRLDTVATPLRVMRIADVKGGAVRIRRDFDAQELGDEPFGWNIPNRALAAALAAAAAETPGVEHRSGTGFAWREARLDEVVVGLSDGARVAARLLLGADGRGSAVRQAAGIAVRTLRYGQKALVFAVLHDDPHFGVSTELHDRGGPFTLVPLPDHEGRPCSAVVWMTDGPQALRLHELPPEPFAAAVNARAAGALGRLEPLGGRQLWPIVTQLADRLVARRTALMAEAAHVVPPIGAQGFNMSLADLRALARLCRDRPGEIGAEAWLDAYERARLPDIRLRALGIDALNRLSQAGLGPLRDLRAAGIGALHALPPLRRGLMRLGLGA